MLRWVVTTSLISLAAFAFLAASTPSLPPAQPIPFSHKLHLDYFRDGRHRRSMVSLHEEILEDYRNGRHRTTMIARHKELLMKELEDEEIVAQMITEQIEPGYCTQCHRDFDSNARDLTKLLACAECHRRREPENKNFAAQLSGEVEQGHCTLCHGDFDRNAGENISRLGHCAECHRVAHDRDWQGRRDQRPCMSCHKGVVQSPWASIPNIETCAACHQPPLEGDYREPQLAEFIEHGKMISWTPVYDYLPGEIVFSHERHAELGRVRCQECHGPVEQAVQPLSLEVKLSMEDCMGCHEAAGANNDCMACHR